MADDGPARLAAIDQELAALGARLDRNARAIMRGDVILLPIALAVIAWVLITRHPVSYWNYAVVWAIVAVGAAGSFIQGRMLRSYRAEIRDLRARMRYDGDLPGEEE